jgi:hypothetical protein
VKVALTSAILAFQLDLARRNVHVHLWEGLITLGHMNVDTFGTSDSARSEPEKQPTH